MNLACRGGFEHAGVPPTMRLVLLDKPYLAFPLNTAAALAKLPGVERKERQTLWAEVDALLQRSAKP